MDRIIVLGSSGSGKSTLARRLGALLAVEVIHLDSYYWQPHWVATPAAEWTARVMELLRGDRWVMDGNYLSSLELRVARADTVIFIDQSRWVCLWRCLRRWARHRGQNRPELAAGCYEKIDLDFLKWIWNYPRDVKPDIERVLEQHSEKRVVWLRGSAAADTFLAQSARAGRCGAR
jgi:adenylate kinase family enzyme